MHKAEPPARVLWIKLGASAALLASTLAGSCDSALREDEETDGVRSSGGRPARPCRDIEPGRLCPLFGYDAGTAGAAGMGTAGAIDVAGAGADAGGSAGTESAGSGGVGGSAGTAPPDEQDPSQSNELFTTIALDDADRVTAASEGDLWVSCWAQDEALYAANGNGRGFGSASADIVVNRIDGFPDDPVRPLAGAALAVGARVAEVWSGSDYDRKPTGMLCLDGSIYVAVQDLRIGSLDDAPAATIVRSDDGGRTFAWDQAGPMFDDHAFTTIMFLDFGKNAEHAPAEHVYAYGLDGSWSFVASDSPPPTKLYLARVPRARVMERAAWEFWSGMDGAGGALWSPDIAARAAVLEDVRRLYAMPVNEQLPRQNMSVLSRGGVVYNAPLARYVLSSWTEYTFELYEAPAPWGPFRHFYSKDFGIYPWFDTKNGGYGVTIPSKFISADGTSMWLQANAKSESGADNYAFSLRQLRVTRWAASEPDNEPDANPLLSAAFGAVPFNRALHYGPVAHLNDRITAEQSDDSWTGDKRALDFWGYTWPRRMRFNRIDYTSGAVYPDGGWFVELGVEVRRGRSWDLVTGLVIAPAYPFDQSVPPQTTFSLRFDEVVGDGLRIIGVPGGRATFTSIAELAVFYE